MNVVDSSAWLEYFADAPNAEAFAAPIEDLPHLVVPTICLYEVFKKVAQQRGEGAALQAVATMRQGRVIDLGGETALQAAMLSSSTGLPLADSVILSTARDIGATVWTQDDDFEGVPGVRYFPKKA